MILSVWAIIAIGNKLNKLKEEAEEDERKRQEDERKREKESKKV